MGFFDIITKVDETTESHKNTETLGSGLKRFASLFLVVGIILGILAQLATNMLGPLGASLNLAGLPPIVAIPILLLIIGIILAIIIHAILFVVMRLLGGNGTYGQQFGISSLIAWPAAIIIIVAYIIATIIMLLGSAGIFIGMLILYIAIGLISVIATYFLIISMKAVHSLSTYKVALAQAITTTIIMLILIAILYSIMSSLVGSLAGGMIPGSPLPFG